ncbi:FtsQ-type POTRA domain-containing protein, partial [Staphylococcus hominis]|uniref:FtsQ-type POTRA domain-containing protein n=1 Tax=Staphylococcus hominis TaxID=1290 RepID=UPI0021B63A56
MTRISHLNITPNHNLTHTQLQKQLNIKKPSPIYTFTKTKPINNLNKNSLIKHLHINKHFPNTLNLKIIQNNLVGILKDKNK